MFPIRKMLALSQAKDISHTMAIFYELDSLSPLKSCTSFPAVSGRSKESIQITQCVKQHSPKYPTAPLTRTSLLSPPQDAEMLLHQ